ncbi:3-keto-5-aminohexanoate cleavage protein [Sinorhizobium sp. Sb3]|uniref:3-keto-5-aminohexanoate cleavage protein n=1 Tax=Sinorhizobium sp. Sb3 TaxID=1358417 RepID=UPI0007C6C2F4|nr:3-keto-5-aminohexanoate cleavage protein [Sinorhizobium sp. Sb3]
MSTTIIEVALNGPWTRKRQPRIPIAADEIVADAVACCKAGASVVHFHAYDVGTGDQTTQLAVIEEIIAGIRAETDALIYPAIRYMSNSEAIQADSGKRRYDHFAALGQRRKLDWLIVDPGSTNLVRYTDGLLDDAVVDINTPAAIRHGLEVAAECGLNPTMAIYDPGYLRLAHHLVGQNPRLKKPMYRFMFSEQLTFGFPPRTYALRAYMELYRELGISAPWMVAGLGTNVLPLVPEVVRRGGHVRAGLEDFELGSETGNVALVEATARAIEAAGGTVASTKEAQKILA